MNDKTATYELGKNEKGDPFIKCLVCGTESYHPKDIEHNYCGKCHQFHQELFDFDFPVFPVTVTGIKVLKGGLPSFHEIGSWVAVRPCAKEHEGKTFLGVYLGDLACDEVVVMLDKNTNALHVCQRENPAIWVPDLKKVVWGRESWWHVIRSPEGLKKITNQDIENVWYMKALKELSEKAGSGGKNEDKDT